MKSPLRRALLLSLGALQASIALQACKKKSDGTSVELVPPTLEFLGATNTAGDEFEPGDDLFTNCDGYLVLHLGPEGDDPGTIENWTFGAPHGCGSTDQCGYVSIELLDGSDEVLATFDQPVASPFLDLSSLDLADVAQLRATLILGNSGVPYEDEEVVVAALWDGAISRDCATPSTGGAGGANTGSGGEPVTGGMPGSGGSNLGSGGGSFGGAGGLGGGGAGG